LLLILPKPSIYPRLLLGTFVGNVNNYIKCYLILEKLNERRQG
jgi:hypothetical protein